MGLSVSGIEMKRVLERHGWYVDRETDHWQMAHLDHPGVFISVPRRRTDLATGTVAQILKLSGLTQEEVRKTR